MTGITLEYKAEQALTAIQAAIDALSAPEKMLRNMGEYLLIATDQRFATQTAPDGTPWAPLSPSYQRSKKKNKDKILVLDGYLKNLMRYHVDGGELLFGSDRIYAALLHFGGAVKHAARASTVYFKQGKDGSIGNRFVHKKKSNFAQDVKIGPYTINMPSRPIVGTSAADDTELLAIASRYLSNALSGARA